MERTRPDLLETRSTSFARPWAITRSQSNGDDLRLNPSVLACDLWEFDAALGRDDREAAVAIYRGPFLNGFHLSDAEEFEQWADGERSRLARRYNQALEQLAEHEARGGNLLRATQWWGRLAKEDSYNSRIALRYMQGLEAAGDRAAALRHASVHSELLRTDLDAAPEREVVAFAERLRLESRAASVVTPAPQHSLSVESDPGLSRRTPARSSGRCAATTDTPQLGCVGGTRRSHGGGTRGDRGTLSHARSGKLVPQRVAAAPFENRTGRPDLDDLGAMAADWMTAVLMETPLVQSPDLEAVYTGGPADSGRSVDPLTKARQDGAAKTVIRGSYFSSGDSVLFQAQVMDVASGRVLKSFEPVGAPVERATVALEALRQEIAGGLSPLVNGLNRGNPVDPDLVLPQSLAAYREFVAGLNAREKLDDGGRSPSTTVVRQGWTRPLWHR